jgi:hypothetical protein
MRSNRKISAKKPKGTGLDKLIRFENREQIEYIEEAARRRGFSFTAFARLACTAVAGRVMALPVDPIFETVADALDEETAA